MVGFLVGLLGRIVRWIPPSAALRLGAVLGLLWFHVVRIRRRTVAAALAGAFPGWDRRRRRSVARGLYVNLGGYAVEFLRASGPARAGAPPPPDVALEGFENYEGALERGRGVIVATAHIGNWDLAACSQAMAGRDITILSRRLSNRGVNRLWMESRRRCGLAILDESAPVSRMADILRRGGTLVLMIDQATPPERGGIHVPFLGKPAWTTRLPALLSMRTGAPIVPVFAESLPGAAHVLHVERPVEDAGGGTTAERAERTTYALGLRLEERIRARPDQWLWLHRRWKPFASAK